MSRLLSKAIAVVLGLLFVAAGVGAATPPTGTSATSSRALQLGIYDDSEVFGHPTTAFPVLKSLHVPVLRVNMHWGGAPLAIAPRRPADPSDPGDPAYNWPPFDEMVKRAAEAHIKLIVTIVGTPGWANGGKARYYAPKNPNDLKQFAIAAAKRYSGDFTPSWADEPLPAIRYWLAWNEPNNPVFIRPQFRKVGKRYVVASAAIYAKICNAIVTGVHSTGLSGEKVACGATAPRGNNSGKKLRASVTPLVFLKALKKAGARFDVYAHHPYYSGPSESPSTPPKGRKAGAVTLGNIGDLLAELKRLYGAGKHLWITEYGYQTKPPDAIFGVSYALQAKYLAQAYALVKRNPRIDMLIWFLLRDDARVEKGWQSGLISVSGKKKPAFATFGRLERTK